MVEDEIVDSLCVAPCRGVVQDYNFEAKINYYVWRSEWLCTMFHDTAIEMLSSKNIVWINETFYVLL